MPSATSAAHAMQPRTSEGRVGSGAGIAATVSGYDEATFAGWLDGVSAAQIQAASCKPDHDGVSIISNASSIGRRSVSVLEYPAVVLQLHLRKIGRSAFHR